MFEGKYGKALTIGLIALIIIVLGVLAFFIVDFVRNTNDKSDAEEAAGYSGSVIKTNSSKQNKDTNSEAVELNVQLENFVAGTGTGTKNVTKTYKGFPMSGSIEIPKINLNIPVLEDASAKAIDVSVAINGGPGLNKVGNTVIIGHNYRDGRFFANLKNISNGDKVYITDNLGTKVEYIVYNIYTTSPEDSDFMDRPTNGAREITLDTCTDDTQSRLIVWAKEK